MKHFFIQAGPDGECEVGYVMVNGVEIFTVVPDASPLMPGDILRVERDEHGGARCFVNDLCVYTFDGEREGVAP